MKKYIILLAASLFQYHASVSQIAGGNISGDQNPDHNNVITYTYQDQFAPLSPNWTVTSSTGSNYQIISQSTDLAGNPQIEIKWIDGGDFTLTIRNGSYFLADIDISIVAPVTWYRDQDGDGYGNPNVTTVAASQPSGYVDNNNDCDDSSTSGTILKTWYRDQDGDGLGTPSTTSVSCYAPAGYVLNSNDCNDSYAASNTDQAWYLDQDGDGYGNFHYSAYDPNGPSPYLDGISEVVINGNFVPRAVISCGPPNSSYNYVLSYTDCDDKNASITTSNNWYPDADGDGFGDVSSSAVSFCSGYFADENYSNGYVRNNLDCNDGDASVNPNRVWFADTDGDGFGNGGVSIQSCTQPTNYVLNNSDCNDTDAQIHPNTEWYLDNDNDGYGIENELSGDYDFKGCIPPSGNNYAINELDCDDTSAQINPETIWYHDVDGDGFGGTNTYTGCDFVPDNHVLVSGDCNDGNSNIHPNTIWYLDADNDGYGDNTTGIQQCSAPTVNYVINAEDCDDADQMVTNPKIWYYDQDGDGYGDGSQPVSSCDPINGYVLNDYDCNDLNPYTFTETIRYIDLDGDGYGTGDYWWLENSGEFEGGLIGEVNVEGFGPMPGAIFACNHYVLNFANDTLFYRSNYLDCYENDATKSVIKHYLDLDRDGYGDASDDGIIVQYNSCFEGFNIPVPEGYAINNDDGNDLDNTINPNSKWYVDSDGDGFGNPTNNPAIGNSFPNDGLVYVLNNLDQCPDVSGAFSGCINIPVNLPNENYIFKRRFKEAINADTYIQIQNKPVVSANDQVEYLDGLGRLIQRTQAHLSPNTEDIVQLYSYDASGRRSTYYLPYIDTLDGSVSANPIDAQQNFYSSLKGDDYSYAKSQYVDGPDDRIEEQGLPGQQWSLDQKSIKFDYDFSSENEVINWDADSLINMAYGKSYYGSDELFKTIQYDEDSSATVEYTNAQGQIILKKSQVNDSIWAETYYIYDVYGNLTTVLPPEASSRLDTEFFNQSEQGRKDFLNRWAFLYDYDGRNRMTMKKVSGADSVLMVYDRWDRLVLTQDGNQRCCHPEALEGQTAWLFTKYDALNRPVMTGLAAIAGTTQQVRDTVQASIARAESFNITGINQYTDLTFPSNSQIIEYLTVTYYDDYDFQSHTDWNTLNLDFNDPESQLNKNMAVKGQVTGTMTKAGNGSWIMSVSYYDHKYRLIQSQNTNHLGGKDVVTNYMDFIGQVYKSISTHSTGTMSITTTRTFEYDHAGRILKIWHQVDNEDLVLIAENRYNELGELIEKNLHDGEQSLDYTYNIRGWLTSTNSSDLTRSNDGDLFGMELLYEEQDASLANNPRFNGNISAMKWSDQSSAGINHSLAFSYSYDKLNRLKTANHFQDSAATTQYGVQGLNYDLNGNIENLQRRSESTTSFMDDLSYTYTGNQLLAVSDAATDTTGFYDGNISGDDYAYDANGNMVKDLNKGIDSIYYNHLNLPILVDFATIGDRIEYLYDAAGIKLSQSVYKGGVLQKKTDYVGEFIYETDSSGVRTLQLIQHEEGRIIPKYAVSQPELVEGYDYQYHLKDHLGNVRVTFSTTPENYTMDATMEDSNESANFNNYVATSASAPEAHSIGHVFRNSNTVNGGLGMNTFLSVNKRDTVKVSAYAYYNDAGGDYNLAAGLIEGALFGTYGGNYGVEGTTVNQSNFNDAFASGTALGGRSGSSDAPKAYINYIFFNTEMEYQRAGFKQITSASNGTSVQVVADEFVADQEGFIMIYLSNETQGSEVVISWDDLEVYHGKTNVVSTQDYYPFGLTFNESVRVASTEQRFKYNGKEVQAGTDWLDYGARMYQPEIGRFFRPDRFAEKYMTMSPYGYAANNPALLVDVNGDSLWINYGDNQRAYYENGTVYNEDGSEYDGDNKFVSAVSTSLNAMSGVEIGNEVLEKMVGSKNNFTFSNTGAGDDGNRTLSFVADKENGGGTINAAALLNSKITDGQKLQSTAHELFHGFQFENGQMSNGRLATVNNEVGAYLFGAAVASTAGHPTLGFGTGTRTGQLYDRSMSSLLYGNGFSRGAYSNAVISFKNGSSVNQSSEGIYSRFPIDSKLKNPVIKRFFPLLR